MKILQRNRHESAQEYTSKLDQITYIMELCITPKWGSLYQPTRTWDTPEGMEM